MKVVHLFLVTLVFSTTLTKLTSSLKVNDAKLKIPILRSNSLKKSHLEEDQTDLSWLDSSFLDQIRDGKLVVMKDRDEEDANSYKSPVSQRILHVWWEAKNGAWRYKVVEYYVAEPLVQDMQSTIEAPTQTSESVVVNEPTKMPAIEPKIETPPVAQPETKPETQPETKPTTPVEPIIVPEEPKKEQPAEPSLPEEPSVPEEPKKIEHICDVKETEIVTVVDEPEDKKTTESSSSSSNNNKKDKFITYYTVVRKDKKDDKEITICKKVKRKIDFTPSQTYKFTMWKRNSKPDIKQVLIDFSNENSPTTQEFSNFNQIAYTDGQEHSSGLNFWESSPQDLNKSLTILVKTFPIIFKKYSIDPILKELEKKENGWKYAKIGCKDLDSIKDRVVKVHAAVLVVGYSKNTDKYQLFAWTGSKRALLKDFKADDDKKNAVKDTLRKWLYSSVGKLATCNASPAREMKIWEDNLEIVDANKVGIASAGHQASIQIKPKSLTSIPLAASSFNAWHN